MAQLQAISSCNSAFDIYMIHFYVSQEEFGCQWNLDHALILKIKGKK